MIKMDEFEDEINEALKGTIPVKSAEIYKRYYGDYKNWCMKRKCN